MSDKKRKFFPNAGNTDEPVSYATRCKIIELQWNNPEMTYDDLAKATGVTGRVVTRTLEPLFDIQLLERPPHGGLSRRPTI